MFKLILAALMVICLANVSTAEKNETKGIWKIDSIVRFLVINYKFIEGGYLQHHYGAGYYGWNYPYSNYYYSWYNLYPNHFSAAAVHAPACNVCPRSCPGTCGLWGSLYACQYSTCSIRKLKQYKLKVIYENTFIYSIQIIQIYILYFSW